jgi:hypothetical protein
MMFKPRRDAYGGWCRLGACKHTEYGNSIFEPLPLIHSFTGFVPLTIRVIHSIRGTVHQVPLMTEDSCWLETQSLIV